jgi:hypothetical protein
MTLTRLDILMIQRIKGSIPVGTREWQQDFKRICNEGPFIDNGWDKEKCRERDESRAKLERLGLL